jgi:hypothetical protein
MVTLIAQISKRVCENLISFCDKWTPSLVSVITENINAEIAAVKMIIRIAKARYLSLTLNLNL